LGNSVFYESGEEKEERVKRAKEDQEDLLYEIASVSFQSPLVQSNQPVQTSHLELSFSGSQQRKHGLLAEK
jgi:hypothetical protein